MDRQKHQVKMQLMNFLKSMEMCGKNGLVSDVAKKLNLALIIFKNNLIITVSFKQ